MYYQKYLKYKKKYLKLYSEMEGGNGVTKLDCIKMRNPMKRSSCYLNKGECDKIPKIFFRDKKKCLDRKDKKNNQLAPESCNQINCKNHNETHFQISCNLYKKLNEVFNKINKWNVEYKTYVKSKLGDKLLKDICHEIITERE